MIVPGPPPTYSSATSQTAPEISRPAPTVSPPRENPPHGDVSPDLERQRDKLDHSFRRWIFGGCAWFSVLITGFFVTMLVGLCLGRDTLDDRLFLPLFVENLCLLVVGVGSFFFSVEAARYGDHTCDTASGRQGCVPCKREHRREERERARPPQQGSVS